jgi:outer membrane protein assembly factor BamB
MRSSIDLVPSRPALILLSLALATPAAGGSGSQFRGVQFRGDAAHTGVFSDVTPGRHFHGLQWRFATGGAVVSSPVMANGVVYVGSGDGKLYAIDAERGVARWSVEAGSAVQSSPAVADEVVYAVNRDGVLIAVGAEQGRELWRFATGPERPWPWGHESGDYFVSSPAIAGDLVLLGAADGWVYALARRTGRLRWKHDTGARIRASVAVADGRVFAGTAGGRLHALDLLTGEERWVFETSGVGLDSADFGYDRRTLQSSPAVADGIVYVGARDGFLYAVDALTGTLRWRVDHQISWVITSPAVDRGLVVVGSSDGAFVQALDARSGEERWRERIGVPVWSSPAVGGDVVYFGDHAGRLHALDRATGERLWHFATRAGIFSSPAVAGSLVVVGSNDGAVYALATGARKVERAVYLPEERVALSGEAAPTELARALEARGYARLDPVGLESFLSQRIADQAPSVVVFPFDEGPKEMDLLRRYLDSGGKVVWVGMSPSLFPRNQATARRTSLADVDYAAPGRLLGVDHERASFDQRGTRITDEGRRWGLDGHGLDTWLDTWGVEPSGVDRTLALDEWGLATSWVKEYGGAAGTGFVRVPGDDPNRLYFAAEYRPLASAPQEVERATP